MLTQRREFLDQPIIRRVKAYSQARVAETNLMSQRLNLLMLNPFTPLPEVSVETLKTLENSELEAALKIAFLQGDSPRYKLLLDQWLASHTQFIEPAPTRQALSLASDLYVLGDYSGSERVLQAVIRENAQLASANDLLKKVQGSRTSAQEQLTSLEMLPRKIPENYWEKTASEALKLGNANWKTHALLADRFESQDQFSLAWTHQKLAARYAPDSRERSKWEKKAAHTERILKKRGART